MYLLSKLYDIFILLLNKFILLFVSYTVRVCQLNSYFMKTLHLKLSL